MKKPSYWLEVEATPLTTNIHREDGDVCAVVHIVGWKPDVYDDVASVMLSNHGDILVSYHDATGRTDEAAQSVIEQAKECLRRHWNEAQEKIERAEIKQQCDLEYEQSRRDIEAYLKAQPNAYFAERGTTLDRVLNDQELMGNLIHEHRRCVYDCGCDPEWSAKDACDNEPGII